MDHHHHHPRRRQQQQQQLLLQQQVSISGSSKNTSTSTSHHHQSTATSGGGSPFRRQSAPASAAAATSSPPPPAAAASGMSTTPSFDNVSYASSSFLDSTTPSFDLSQFQDSWANNNGQDFLETGVSALGGGGTGSIMTDFQSFLGNNSMRSSFTGNSMSTSDFTAGGGGGGNSLLLLSAPDRPLALSRCISSAPHVVVSSEIHNASRITDWDRVLELCASNPEQAKYTGADGWTALHHACNRRCPRPEVVEALIKAYPDALMTEEEKGRLPLHYACRFKAPKDVVSLLLHMHPEKGKIGVTKKDNLGRTPLYYAVRYDAPPGVLGVLLKVNPSAVLEEDQHDDSPLNNPCRKLELSEQASMNHDDDDDNEI